MPLAAGTLADTARAPAPRARAMALRRAAAAASRGATAARRPTQPCWPLSRGELLHGMRIATGTVAGNAAAGRVPGRPLMRAVTSASQTPPPRPSPPPRALPQSAPGDVPAAAPPLRGPPATPGASARSPPKPTNGPYASRGAGDAPPNRKQGAAATNRRTGDFAAGSVSPGSAPPPLSVPAASPRDVTPRVREPASLRDALAEHKIALPSYAPGQHRLQCPVCRGGTDGERSLAVNVTDGGNAAVWLCHRATCGVSGKVNARASAAEENVVGARAAREASEPPASRAAADAAKPPPDLPREEDILPVSSNAAAAAFFRARGISEATLMRTGVGVTRVWSPVAKAVTDVIVFPYRRAGTLVNCKYRALESKTFWQSRGGDKVLYGLDDVADAEQVIIVEGEMDKLAMEQAGFRNCVSVPDGAPAKVKDGPTPSPDEDKKFSYLWNCRAYLDRVKTFIIAVDADEPGDALAEELARRLGRERCWRVSWPGCALEAATATAALDPAAARKDANEVLMKDGPQALGDLVAAAQPVPIRGLFQFTDFGDEIDRYYGLELHSELRGLATGWDGVDALYRVVPGELTVVTGVPNSGKSEWVDALMCNLAHAHGWSFALCSMENKVHEHARKLIEKHVGRPFFDAEYAGAQRRMSAEELAKGKAFLAEHFVLIRHEDDELPSIDWVLGLARAAVLRYGIRGLLIDPYNELDHRRPANVSETEYVSQMLTRIKRFAAHHDVHVWFVAHPRQQLNWRGEPPGLYEISGSAHFVNKCDNGLVVHRNRTDPGRSAEVRVLVQKVRNKVAGRIGETTLLYDRACGRYADSDKAARPLRMES